VLVGAAIRDERSTNPPMRREDLVMWGLTDPQRATRIVMDTSEFYVRQLLVRAMAVGESIAIYSDQPARWLPLAQTNIAVVERRRAARLRADHRGRRPAHRAAIGGPVLDGDHPGPGDTRGPAPDLRFVQTSQPSVRVSSADRTMDLAIVAFRREQAWTG
jgi:hypothetical protein